MFITNSIQRILSFIILLAVLPVFFVILASGIRNRNDVVDTMITKGNNALFSFSQEHTTTSMSVETFLTTLTEKQIFLDITSIALVEEELRQLKTSIPYIDQILIAADDGTIIANSAGKLDPRESALNDLVPLLDSNETYYTGPIGNARANTTYKSYPHVLVFTQDAKKKYFVAYSPLNLRLISLAIQQLPFGAKAFIFDANGKELFQNSTSEDQKFVHDLQQNIWEQLKTDNPIEGTAQFDSSFTIFRKVPLSTAENNYMVVAITSSHDDLYADANRELIQNICLVAFIAFVAWVIALIIGRAAITNPLKALINSSAMLAKGDLSARSLLSNSKGEMGKLAKAFDDMASSLEQHHIDLLQALDDADAGNKAKSEFIANMNHEIRTPLNAVIGMAILAMKSGLNSKQHAYISKIYSAGSSLLAIINDILDFSMLETGQLHIENTTFNLEETLDEIVSVSSHRLEEKEIEVLFGVPQEIPPSLTGDQLRLSQILTNLLNNAIKFTERGEITISCRLIEHMEDSRVKLEFSVQDSGIGISEEQQKRLFSPFTQADSSITRKFGGTGLGLTICKNLVEMLDGTISVTSKVGEGSTFAFTAVFSLPANEQQHTNLYFGTARILIIDGNSAARRILRSTLNSMLFQADTAGSSEEGMCALLNANEKGTPYHVVLVDWRLPEKNGIETTKDILTSLKLEHIPSIFITSAVSYTDLLPLAEKVGATGVLYKPINKSTLFDTLVDALHENGNGATKPKIKNPKEYTDILDKQHDIFGASVLLVEDNIINQQIAEELLLSAGATVYISNNGKEAVEFALQKGTGTKPPFSFVLMDLQMPDMDGYEATRILRKRWNKDELPIIAMTAHATAEDIDKCLSIGMNAHITKPIEVDTLFSVITHWFSPLVDLSQAEFEKKGFARTTSSKIEIFSVPEELKNISGIDVMPALSRLSNNISLYEKLLRQFAEQYASLPEEFYGALAANDLETAERIAHTLKGLAGSIGAPTLAQKAAALERVTAQHKIPAITFYALPCFEALQHIIKGLQKYFNLGTMPELCEQNDTITQPELDECISTLKRISKLLEDADADATVAFAKKEELLRKTLSSAIFQELHFLLTRYEFDKANAAVQSALQQMRQPTTKS